MDIGSFITPFAVAIVIGWLLSSARATAPTIEGRTTVGYGWGFKGFAVFMGIASLSPFVLMFMPSADDRIWVLALVAIMAIPTTYLLLEGFFVRVVFSDKGIEVYSPWRRNRTVAWSEVRKVRYSAVLSWHVVETTQGPIRLHDMKSGVASLLAELQARGVSGSGLSLR
ncbi:MAG: PH domain-containing protein [Lysobacter sp.]|nr:PH domain-containing protein [Lysobacter sp.]